MGGFRLTSSGVELCWELSASPVRPTELAPAEETASPARVDGHPRSQRPPPRPPLGPEHSPVWTCRARLRALEPDEEEDRLATAARALESATRSTNGNYLRFRPALPWSGHEAGAFPMTEREVALMFPSGGADHGSARPSRLRAAPVLALGRDPTGTALGPPVEPEQGRHLAILGETGMGKSSLLVSVARRSIALGGLLLFDPLGETAGEVRAALAPELGERLLWIDPTGPSSFNALAALGSAEPAASIRRERQLNELVVALRRVRTGRYAESGFWGPRLEEMLARALGAAASLPGGTLETAHALLASEGRGLRGVPSEAMEAVRALSERIRSRPEDADGARRLLFEVTRSPTLVQRLCAPSPDLTSADLVRPGRVVLVSGEAATVGESTARYLLAVLLAMAWSELLAREALAKTWVVLDEAQWFAHDSLAEMLRLGRRRNVHVVVATQALRSLPESVAEAVGTNASDFVLFRGSPNDAREVARSVRGIDAEAVLALPRGHALLLLGKGASVHWIRTARTPTRETSSTAAAPKVEPPEVEEDRQQGRPTMPEHPTPRAELLRTIARLAQESGGNSPVRIRLDELRRSVDPEGSEVRRAGAELRRCGAIVGTGRDASGAYWWVDPARLPPPEDPGPSGPADP